MSPMDFFSENVDRWGAAEWFDRLSKAIREQDKAVVAGDDISFETYRMIAASSAMRLVREFEANVSAALAPDTAARREDREELYRRLVGARATLMEEYANGRGKVIINFDNGNDAIDFVAVLVEARAALEREGRDNG